MYLGLVITALVPLALLPVGVLSRKRPTEAGAAAVQLVRQSATPLLSAHAGNDSGPICNGSNSVGCTNASGSSMEERHHGGGAAEHAIELAGSVKLLPDLEAGRGPDGTFSPRKFCIAANTLLDRPDPRDVDDWLISAPRRLLPGNPGLAVSSEAAKDATIHGLVTPHGGKRCWEASDGTTLQQVNFSSDSGGTLQAVAVALTSGGAGDSTHGGAGAAGGQGCGATLDHVSSLAATEFFSVHSSYSALDRLAAGAAAASPRGGNRLSGPLWRQYSDANASVLESTIHEGSVLADDMLLLSPRAPGVLSPPRGFLALGMLPSAEFEDHRGTFGRGELALASPSAASTRVSGDVDPVVLKASGTAAAATLSSTAAVSSDGHQLHRRLSSRRLLPPLLSKSRSMDKDDGGTESAAISLSSPKELSRKNELESVAAGPSWPNSSSSAPAPALQVELGVWAGIRQVLLDPHGAAFFATALNMGLACEPGPRSSGREGGGERQGGQAAP